LIFVVNNLINNKYAAETKYPSPDGSGYPFAAAFGAKDRNVQPE